MIFFEFDGLSYLFRCKVVGDHSIVVEMPPLLIRKVEDLRLPNGQWNDKLVWQVAKDPYKPSFPKVY